MIGLLMLGIGLLLMGLLLCNCCLFKYLMILEKYKVMVLLMSLDSLKSGCRMMFICMMSVFVVEASLMLMIMGVKMKSGCLRMPLGL